MKDNTASATRMVALAIIALGIFGARNASAQCDVNFSDTFALTNIYSQARLNVGAITNFDSSGHLQVCPDVNAWSTCWAYRQRCGTLQNGAVAYANVWPWAYGHMHLGFVDNRLNQSCFCDPHDGLGAGDQYKNNNVCGSTSGGCPNWKTLPRYGTPHDNAAWLLIWTEQGGDGAQHVFQMPTIGVGNGPAIQLWYTAADGSGWGWGSLGPNTNWGVNIPDATQVWIAAASGSGTAPVINDYTLTPRY